MTSTSRGALLSSRLTMADQQIDPPLQGHAFPHQTASKIVPGAGRKNGQRCFAVDGQGQCRGFNAKFKEPSRRLAQCAVTADYGDGSYPSS